MGIKSLKEKLIQKLDNEYDNWIKELKTRGSDEIIDNAYQLVIKQESMNYLQNRDYSKTELKSLIKAKNLLGCAFDEWIHSDGNDFEFLEYSTDRMIDHIRNNYLKNINAKNTQDAR